MGCDRGGCERGEGPAAAPAYGNEGGAQHVDNRVRRPSVRAGNQQQAEPLQLQALGHASLARALLPQRQQHPARGSRHGINGRECKHDAEEIKAADIRRRRDARVCTALESGGVMRDAGENKGRDAASAGPVPLSGVCVQQTDEVAAAVADGAVERRVAGNSREKVDVSAVGQEALAHVDAAELRDDVQGRVACERAVHDAAAARGARQAGGRKSGSKHADKIATLWRCVRNSELRWRK